jgi:hypothetical protein
MSFGGSSFHSAWSGSGSWPLAHYRKFKPVEKKTQHHSLIGNLVRDVRDAAVGIPMGLVETGKSEYHDVGHAIHGDYSFKDSRKLGEAMGKSMAYTYTPLVHGKFGEFGRRVKEHPLAPILDAISVVTLPLGGLGVGIKTADTLAMAARGGRAIRGLHDVADAFRPIHTRELTAIKGVPTAYRHYATNPATRLAQKLVDKSTSKVPGLTDEARHNRWLEKDSSARSSATDAMWIRQFRAIKKLFGDSSVTAQDLAHAIDPGVRSAMVSHAHWVPESRLASGKGTAAGWKYVAETPRPLRIPATKDPQAFAEWIKNQGYRHTTGSPKRALTRQNSTTGEREFAVVRDSRDVTRMAERSFNALKALHDKPLKVWKWMVLATAPRYFVNNVVGNSLMYAFSANPVAASRGMYHAIADIYGKKVALRGLRSIDREMARMMGDWQDKWYLGAHQGFAYDIAEEATKLTSKGDITVPGKLRQAGQRGLYGVTHNVAEILPRRAAINYLIKRRPEYQSFYRAERAAGRSARESHQIAADKASESAKVRDWVSNHAEDVLGQYHHFSGTEKGIKAVVPFYSWDRAIMRHTKAMVLHRPYEAAFLARLGQQGTKETEEMLGKIPDFLKGAIPLKAFGLGDHDPSHGILSFILGQKHGDRVNVLTTQGLNPYASVADITDALDSLVEGNPKVGESLGGQLSPFIAGAIQHVTGQSLLSGSKISREALKLGGHNVPGSAGLIGSVLRETGEETPAAKIISAALRGRPHPKPDANGKIRSPLLYRQDLRQQLSSALGIPIKEFSPEKAAELYASERGVSKSRRRKRNYKPAPWSHTTWSTRRRYRRVAHTIVSRPSRHSVHFPHPHSVVKPMT